MDSLLNEELLEKAKKIHCNQKCNECEHRIVNAYEDGTILSYTPYHWWQGECEINHMKINSDELPECPI